MTTPFDMVMRNDLDRFHLVARRHRPGARPGLPRGVAAPAPRGRATPGACLRPRAWRGLARDPRLALDRLTGDGAHTVRILVLNAGSSNLKASVIEPPDRAPAVERTIDWIDDGRDGVAATIGQVLPVAGAPIEAIGHRVVHGGERFTGSTRLDDEAVAAIETLADLAPLHNPLAAGDHPSDSPAPARCAAGGIVRYRLPRDPARVRSSLSGAR